MIELNISVLIFTEVYKEIEVIKEPTYILLGRYRNHGNLFSWPRVEGFRKIETGTIFYPVEFIAIIELTNELVHFVSNSTVKAC